MLKGQELGQAIKAAINRKLDNGSVKTKAEIARHFGMKPPSLSDWERKGSVSKDKLPELWRFFADVAGPEHWGMTAAEWPAGLALGESNSPKANEPLVLQETPAQPYGPTAPTWLSEAHTDHPVVRRILGMDRKQLDSMAKLLDLIEQWGQPEALPEARDSQEELGRFRPVRAGDTPAARTRTKR